MNDDSRTGSVPRSALLLSGRERGAAERVALTDTLTRLANRRHAMLFLEAGWAAARRGRPLSVVVFDIDDFQRVNDRHGPAAADEVLRSFGQILLGRTRAMDLSARVGGEEFVSILVDSAAPDAARFAEDVRRALTCVRYDWGHVTASAGVAEYARAMDSPEAILSAAERALDAAKEAGRDRVRCRASLDMETSTHRAIVVPDARREPGMRGRELLAKATVLLVDDDPGLLRATRRTLEQLGCRVEGFTNPFDAVRHVQERKVAPHLLVTDVVMPEMSGFALVDMMGRFLKDVPVLYVSGYDRRDVYWDGAPGGRSALLGKPYSPAQLEEALVRLLADGTAHRPRKTQEDGRYAASADPATLPPDTEAPVSAGEVKSAHISS